MKTHFIYYLAIALVLVVQACGSKSSESEAPEAGASVNEAVNGAEEQATDATTETAPPAEADAATSATTEGATTGSGTTYTDETGATVYNVAEVMPSYKGGNEAMTRWLSSNLSYPSNATEEGTVFVEFVVDKEGKVRSSKVIKAPADKTLSTEALRAVNKMPKWEPGKQAGVPVDVKFTLPITFKK